MTAVGYVIQPGESIPEDVTAFTAAEGERASRATNGTETGGPWLSAACTFQCIGHFAHEFSYPLTVTAVREQPAEPDPVSYPVTFNLPEQPTWARRATTPDETGDDVTEWRFDPRPEFAADPYPWVSDEGDGSRVDWFDLLSRGGVTVLPPEPEREPRTWPKLSKGPADVRIIRGASGQTWYRDEIRHDLWKADNGAIVHGDIPGLQALDGPLVEVFDDKDSTG